MTRVLVSEPSAGVRQLLLNRPDRRNALDLKTVAELSRLMAEGPPDVVILGSTDHSAFSAGVDLSIDPSERAEVSRSLYSLYRLMQTSEALVVAAVSGHAIGGGAQLMIASDLRVASPSVSIKFAGPGHGLAVGAWGLPALVGRGRAIELILTMRSVAAKEALALGLVDRVEADPLAWAAEFAREAASRPSGVTRSVKRISAMTDAVEALDAEQENNDDWDGTMPRRGGVDPG